MENNKNQVLILTIIGIATLLVAIVGTTFAWFSIKLADTEEKEEKVITKATLASVVFEDGTIIDSQNLFMKKNITKKFKVSQADKSSKEILKYNILLNIVSNNINTEEQPNVVLHSLTSSGNSNGGTTVSLESTNIPSSSIVIGSGLIDGYEIHEYEYSVTLNNANPLLYQGKEFEAYLSVELIEENNNESE